MLEGAKIEMEIRAMDHYKDSLAFDAFMHRKFRNGLKECQSFLQDMVNKETLVKLDAAIQNNAKMREQTQRKLRKQWRAHCRMKKLTILDMHLELPSKEGIPKLYENDK
ncbi:hypothetical protein ACOSP7_019503 [Xanthoceras sorbifolium]